MKLCGCKEQCFVNGEKVWGIHGNSLCLYATDVGICDKTKEHVLTYISEQQYKEIRKVI